MSTTPRLWLPWPTRLALCAALVGLTCALPACRSSKAEKKDATSQKTRTIRHGDDGALDQDGPTPEELADSPCGNADWASLPEGMDPAKQDAPADTSPQNPDQAPDLEEASSSEGEAEGDSADAEAD